MTNYTRALFLSGRRHYCAGHFPVVIALHAQDFFSRANFAGIHDFDRECRFRFCPDAMHYSRSRNAVIRVYNEAGNVMETHDQGRRKSLPVS